MWDAEDVEDAAARDRKPMSEAPGGSSAGALLGRWYSRRLHPAVREELVVRGLPVEVPDHDARLGDTGAAGRELQEAAEPLRVRLLRIAIRHNNVCEGKAAGNTAVFAACQ